MAIVSPKDNNVCACGSNRTWLLILATIEIVSNAFFFIFVVAALCVVREAVQEGKEQDPTHFNDAFEEFMLGFGRDILVVAAVLLGLSLFASFCPILAETKKRAGFLIPWYVLIVGGLVYDIAVAVICLIHGNFPAFLFLLLQLALDVFAVIVTKRRHEELLQIAAAAENGHVVSGGSAANYGAAVESGGVGYKPLM